MTAGLNAANREALSSSAQLPSRFWLDPARGHLMPEMALLHPRAAVEAAVRPSHQAFVVRRACGLAASRGMPAS